MNIEKIVKNDFIFYKTQLLKIFKENYFENGGMLYSDDFLTNSDYIFIVKQNNKIIAYMAVSKLTEKIFNILPILRELNFNHTLIRESYLINEEWYLYDLGFGNHLLIRDKELEEKLMNKFSNYQINELYKLWEEILKNELKFN